MAEAVNDIEQKHASGIISVRQMLPADEIPWDKYVQKNPNSVFFHRSGWSRLINRVYGYKSYNLIAERDGCVVGILPLTCIKSPIAGRALISSGFAIGGGVIADSAQISHKILDHANALGRDLSVSYIELRSEKALFQDLPTKNTTYANFIKSLPASDAEILSAIPKKRRAEVRKAIKLQDTGKLTIVEERDVDRFFKLYALSLRDHGTPVFPKKFIDTVLSIFPEDVTVLTAEYEGRAVASLVSFYHHDRVMPYYVGAASEARGLRAFDYLYWQQMLKAKHRGSSLFDFGRSKFDVGSFGYKKTWGFEPTPLEYQYSLIDIETIPDVNPNNPKYALATKIWQKLPVPIATFGGAILARHFA